MKPSLHIWYGMFKDFDISIGYVVAPVEGGLFVLYDTVYCIVIAAVVLNIDDLFIIANEGLIVQIRTQMKKMFWLHDLASVLIQIRMNIKCNWEHHTIDIHQHSDIRTIFAKFRMDQSRLVTTLMAMKFQKRKPRQRSL